MADMRNIEMGPCAVSLDGEDAGHTLGATMLRVEPRWRPRREARHGATDVDMVLLGLRVTVHMTLAEKTLATMQRAMPHGAPSADYLGLGDNPGLSLASRAVSLTLHPLEVADSSRDVTLHRAACHSAVAIAWEHGQERAFDVAFTAFLDTAQSVGEWLGQLKQA